MVEVEIVVAVVGAVVEIEVRRVFASSEAAPPRPWRKK